MTRKPFVSVIVPVYNEEDNVAAVDTRLRNVLEEHASDHEVIFVDDGSTDRTVERISAIHARDARVKCLSFSRNFGHQAALTAGLDVARGEVVISMDGDLQHPPEEIPRFLELWREGYDIVNGVKQGTGARGPLQAVLASAFYTAMSYLSDVEIDPHGSDFRLLSRRAATAISGLRERTRFLRGLVKWVGFRSTRLPYRVAPRASGEAKYTLRSLTGLAAAGIFSFSTVPLRLGSYAGLLLACVSLLYACYAVFARVVWGRIIEGWASLVVVVVLIGSAQLVTLGILGEYVASLVSEAKGRPLYVVAARVGLEEPEAPR